MISRENFKFQASNVMKSLDFNPENVTALMDPRFYTSRTYSQLTRAISAKKFRLQRCLLNCTWFWKKEKNGIERKASCVCKMATTAYQSLNSQICWKGYWGSFLQLSRGLAAFKISFIVSLSSSDAVILMTMVGVMDHK
jgi:hypothetical protein